MGGCVGALGEELATHFAGGVEEMQSLFLSVKKPPPVYPEDEAGLSAGPQHFGVGRTPFLHTRRVSGDPPRT